MATASGPGLSSSSPLLIALSTVPDKQTGSAIARALVESRLAACVSIIPGIQSIYSWQGAVEDSAELLLLIKTTPERYPELKEKLLELHPYDTPELIALCSADVHEKYLAWAKDSVRP